MTTIETPPALAPAERLAEVVQTSPDTLTKQIAGSTLDQLDALARVIDEKKITVQDTARTAIRARYDVLEAIDNAELEKLETQAKLNHQLVRAASRLHLMRLLDIPAPSPPDTSRFAGVASFLNGVSTTTSKIPLIGFLTSFLKDMRGRSLERILNNVLAIVEKNPSTVGGSFLGPMGSLVGMLGINFGARRRLLELDILDEIDANKRIGEQIAFAGIGGGELEKFKEKLATANIRELTSKFLSEKRKLTPIGEPIIITLETILHPEQTQSKVAEKEVNDKKNIVIARWKPLDITSVKFGTPASATKNSTGRFDITIPEDGLRDGSPISAEAMTLQAAMKNLPEAKEIIIIASTEELTLDLTTKTAHIPANVSVVTESLNRALGMLHPRLTKIVFATPAKMMTDKMLARFDAGTLSLSANSTRIQSLNQLSGLTKLLDSAEEGENFTFKNGSWLAKQTSIPAASTPILQSIS